MTNFKKIFSFLMCLALLLCVGCKQDEKKQGITYVTIPRPSASDEAEVEAEEEIIEDDNYYYDDNNDYSSEEEYISARPLPEKVIETTKKYVPEYTVKASAWSGPAGYSIVYPKGNIQLKNAAEKLQKYFKEKSGVDLKVVDDTSSATAKEILIGNTARKKSSLPVTKYAVKKYGDKIFFESGNFNGAIKAVKWFVSFGYKKGSINLLEGEYEIEVEKKRDRGLYKLVWADEFDGNTVDEDNWVLNTHMGTQGEVTYNLSKDERNISVAEGNLHLAATSTLDPRNSKIKYSATYTVTSQFNMNFQYGYAELRAIYPQDAGAWPSWWLNGDCKKGPVADVYPLGNIYDTDFNGEMDILEYTTLLPNMHKWYFDGNHTNWSLARPVFENIISSDSKFEYHIFSLEWTPDGVDIFLDGEPFRNNFDFNDIWDEKENTDFKNPFSIMINNHILPQNVPNTGATFPFDYYIDYVRIYQMDGEGGIWIKD